MGVLTLLRQAKAAGLAVAADGERLTVRGPKSAAALARELGLRKPEVLAALAGTSPPTLPTDGRIRPAVTSGGDGPYLSSPGWTPASWAHECRRRAKLCDTPTGNREAAARYRRWAEALAAGPDGGCSGVCWAGMVRVDCGAATRLLFKVAPPAWDAPRRRKPARKRWRPPTADESPTARRGLEPWIPSPKDGARERFSGHGGRLGLDGLSTA